MRALRQGGLVLHATEGVWGLACDPWSPNAVARLLAFKGRAVAKGLIVIGAQPGCFAPELELVAAEARDAVLACWPGAVTWILPNRRFPRWVTGGRGTVAVRVPGHPQARALCRAFGGPLVSSSANRAGRPPARRRLQARALVRDSARAGFGPNDPGLFLLPGETSGRRGPSEIRTLAGVSLRSSA